MKIELGNIPLVMQKEEEGKIVEVRSVMNIKTYEKRNIVEHKIPGMEGNIFQDLGRDPVKISFEGTFQGGNAKENLETIRSKFKLGAEIPFNSDITGASEVSQVLIGEFGIEDIGGIKNQYKYYITLREYKIPIEEETPAPEQEEQAKDAVEDMTDDALGSINYITGKVLDANSNPKKGVNVKITWDEGEIAIKTNEEGIYKQDNLEPGKYTIKVDAEGYERTEKEVIIKTGKEKAEMRETISDEDQG